MINRIISFIALFASITSCTKKDNNYESIISNYHYFMMDTKYSMTPTEDDIVSLEYDNYKRPNLRIGNDIPTSRASGFRYAFSKNAISEIEYDDNYAIIKYYYDDTVLEKQDLVLFNDDKIISKEIKHSETNIDLISYEYEGNKIVKTNESFYEDRIYVFGKFIIPDPESSTTATLINKVTSNYNYNSSGNLDSISSQLFHNNSYLGKTVEIFNNFDNVRNPLSRLTIFEETFIRSLSKNNYSKITTKSYGPNGESYGSYMESTWTLKYYENGEVNFGR